MEQTITKQQAKALLGLTYDVELADFYGVSKATVSLWGEKLPKTRYHELFFRRPDLFGAETNMEMSDGA